MSFKWFCLGDWGSRVRISPLRPFHQKVSRREVGNDVDRTASEGAPHYSLFPNGVAIDGMIDLSLVGTEIDRPEITRRTMRRGVRAGRLAAVGKLRRLHLGLGLEADRARPVLQRQPAELRLRGRRLLQAVARRRRIVRQRILQRPRFGRRRLRLRFARQRGVHLRRCAGSMPAAGAERVSRRDRRPAVRRWPVPEDAITSASALAAAPSSRNALPGCDPDAPAIIGIVRTLPQPFPPFPSQT